MPGNKIGAAKGLRARQLKGRDADGFTDKERAFVLHFMGAANRVGTEAAVLAGYSTGNRAGARRYASELMGRPHIVAEIERITVERAERLGINADDVLRRLLVIETEATLLPKTVQTLRLRREVVKDIGDHVAVGAFKKQVGLSGPNGGPIETVDLAMLANLSDEELDQLERARSIIDRVAGRDPAIPDVGGDQGGEGTAPPEA